MVSMPGLGTRLRRATRALLAGAVLTALLSACQGQPDTYAVTLRVSDESGAPLSGCAIDIVGGQVALPEIGRLTNADGEHGLSLPPGDFEAKVTCPPNQVTKSFAVDLAPLTIEITSPN